MKFLWKVFWEFPVTAFISSSLIVVYFSVLLFVPAQSISQYFLAFPSRPNPVNWLLSLFFHGSPGHLFSNLIFLVFLGRAVEAKVSKGKWLLYYFMAGLVSILLDSLIRGGLLTDNTPLVGASGAISGLAAVSALISPFNFKVNKLTIPFPVFVISWLMIYSDFMNLFSTDNIAHWAHLGGFVSVFVTAYFLSPEDQKKLKNGFILNLLFFTLTVILLFFITNR